MKWHTHATPPLDSLATGSVECLCIADGKVWSPCRMVNGEWYGPKCKLDHVETWARVPRKWTTAARRNQTDGG